MFNVMLFLVVRAKLDRNFALIKVRYFTCSRTYKSIAFAFLFSLILLFGPVLVDEGRYVLPELWL